MARPTSLWQAPAHKGLVAVAQAGEAACPPSQVAVAACPPACMAAGALHVVGGPFMGDRGNCVVVRGRMGDDVLAWLRGDPIFRNHAQAWAGQYIAGGGKQEGKMEVASHLRGAARLAGLTVTGLNASAAAFGRLRQWVRAFKHNNGVVLRQLAGMMQAKLSKIKRSELGANGVFLANDSTEGWLWSYACLTSRTSLGTTTGGFSAVGLPHDLGPAPIGVPYVHRGYRRGDGLAAGRCLREPHVRLPSPGAAWRACGRLEEGQGVGVGEDLRVVEVPRVSQHTVRPHG